jgi:hypothetical protein
MLRPLWLPHICRTRAGDRVESVLPSYECVELAFADDDGVFFEEVVDRVEAWLSVTLDAPDLAAFVRWVELVESDVREVTVMISDGDGVSPTSIIPANLVFIENFGRNASTIDEIFSLSCISVK